MQTLNTSHIPVEPDFSPPPFGSFNKVTESEVKKFIMSSPTKSCQLDPWPTFLVKDCLDILITPITSLVNLSLSRGIFPNTFKQAIITPLIKKPSLPKNDFKNYRPVSGLNFLSKLIERVVASQIKSHLHTNGLENNFQSAYKENHSTETALLKIKNDIHLSLSQGKPSALVLLDLSAAFDTIDHCMLLNRLSSWFGVSSKVLSWFSSYISNRSQSVKIGNTLSDLRNLNFGVPQGSVLGPILFTLYTYPLSKIISSYNLVKHHLYADDTQIYIDLTTDNAPSAISQLQKCLTDIQLWMNSNKLKLNPDKTEFMIIGTDNQRNILSKFLPVNILGNDLYPSTSVRNLGVIFDSDFKFSKHVSSICSSCFYHIRDFSRVRRHLDTSAAIILANALVSSRLDYCNSLFYSLRQCDKKRLQHVQNTLCRIVSRKSRFTSITPERKKLHWLPIEYRIQFKINLLTFKTLNSSSPPYLKVCLNPYSSNYNTRRSNPNQLILQTVNYNKKIHSSFKHLQHSYAYSAPRLWNNLPHHVRSSPKISTFRKRLKSHLFSLAYPP